MSRMYETIYIVQPDLGDEEIKALSTKVQDVIASMNGDFKRVEDWGTRKLAYPINKNPRGRYFYLRFDGDSGLIAELERRLRLDDKVIRYQSVKLETEVVAPAAAPVKSAEEGTEEVAAEAATEAPAETTTTVEG
ncbi:ribosomal protein S6 [Citrifermentans bemidjiense Bem]|uniref:Small ribosomal subunit protein bS6 n=1 Tax=Citrifermentans bemidjiense (strain ATCC BAA-1014 / DSM 16622 / JCM 12645 / Bem) TaxID=404380 RepID=RS6_CITBB|nr:30S ribosomal protein S6 [Citrifermentans bemidjiense]B5EHW9.1 RecName: Full=Small ribosomal subunit protein bS6; AltName: Full=30S ribosomal protein S6 [Citrifermentans bemidjiense Bem]ACH39768.1 ribosomal protein S6 [Citrifermentans bemidjiense Bem]